jgi:hypothetical protein
MSGEHLLIRFVCLRPIILSLYVTCGSRDIRLRGNQGTDSPYSGEQAGANGLVRSTLLSRSRKGCCVVQRKIPVEGYLLFMESGRAKAFGLLTLLGVQYKWPMHCCFEVSS